MEALLINASISVSDFRIMCIRVLTAHTLTQVQ